MARLYRHKVHGWQIHYWIHFGDGTRKRKFRYYRNKLKPSAIFPTSRPWSTGRCTAPPRGKTSSIG